MKPEEISVAMMGAGLPIWVGPFCYDASYGKPTEDWLLNKFWPWFRDTRFEANKHKWTPKNDCDNFARRWAMECQDAHADTDQGDEGLAVGEFCYHASSGAVQGPHAIVVAITDQGVIFIEPQTGQRLTLTPNEIISCFRVSF